MSVRTRPLVLMLVLLSQVTVARAQRPKVAVVVAGDPEAELRELAQRLNDALDASPELRLPADRALVAAMAGAPDPAEDDGLGRVRGLRRRLGWEQARDASVLRTLGRGAGAQALVVLRRVGEGTRLEVFDVGARRFYEDQLSVDPQRLEASLAFIVSRARAAGRRAHTASAEAQPRERTERVHEDAAARAPTTHAGPDLVEPAAEDDAAHGVRAWFRHNWAYVVGGVLLAGVALGYGLAQRGGGSSSNPTLRFRPGGE